MRYSISEPRVYLFEVADAPSVLRNAAEAVLRERVSGETFADLLTTDRGRFQDEVLERACAAAAQEYGPGGLGIESGRHRPARSASAARSRARLSRRHQSDGRRATAHQQRGTPAALTQERRQEAESRKVVREAEAAKQEKIALAKAQQAAFLARYERAHATVPQAGKRCSCSPPCRARCAADTAAEVERDYAQRRAAALKQQADLTDFRLYWEMLAST